jgi:hypothetical protein
MRIDLGSRLTCRGVSSRAGMGQVTFTLELLSPVLPIRLYDIIMAL